MKSSFLCIPEQCLLKGSSVCAGGVQHWETLSATGLPPGTRKLSCQSDQESLAKGQEQNLQVLWEIHFNSARPNRELWAEPFLIQRESSSFCHNSFKELSSSRNQVLMRARAKTCSSTPRQGACGAAGPELLEQGRATSRLELLWGALS